MDTTGINNITTFPIIESAAVIIAAVVTGFIVPYIKGRIGAERLRLIIKWVKVAVAAAEQIFKGSRTGENKLAYVQEFLEGHGFNVSDDVLNTLIESAVFELKNRIVFGEAADL